MTIQWYPGHMAKAKRLIKENMALVDITIQVVDARIPFSSINPDFEKMFSQKPRVIALNKKDLADKNATTEWIKFYKSQGMGAVAVNAARKEGIRELIKAAEDSAEHILRALEAKNRNRRPIRVMVVGIPNVGKSTVINAMVGKGTAKTGDKPGVTKGKQWVHISKKLSLLDTPGVLWPKFEDPEVGFRLAATGAISDLVYSVEEVALKLVDYLCNVNPEAIKERFKIDEISQNMVENIELIGKKRGLLIAGGTVNTEQTAIMILHEFRSGKLGRYTLDSFKNDL